MAGKYCPTCKQQDHHNPQCPEMFWPDGLPRGVLQDPPPLPPFETDPIKRANYKIEFPGGYQPIGVEMGKIFAGLTERAIERHVAELAAADDGIPF